MPQKTQNSFNGGELADTLHGRTDLARYPVSVARMSNFVPLAHGPVTNRRGTMLGDAFLALAFVGLRQVEFMVGTSSHLLVFGTVLGVSSFRAYRWQDGAWYCYSSLAVPWTAAQIAEFQWAQFGDLMVIVHQSVAPQMLKRLTGDAWSLAAVAFAPPASFLEREAVIQGPRPEPDETHPVKPWQWEVTATVRYPDGSIVECMPQLVTQMLGPMTEEWTPGRAYEPGYIVHYGSQYWQRANLTPSPPAHYSSDLNSAPPGSAVFYYMEGQPGTTMSAGPWNAVATPAGQGLQPAPLELACYPDMPVTITWEAPGAAAAEPTDYVVLYHSVYRGRDGEWGWVGDTTTLSFLDGGQLPDLQHQPPKGTNPFDMDGTPDWPGCVAFHEQRLWFARTARRPQTIFGSAVGRWMVFDRKLYLLPTDALEIIVSSSNYEQIQSLVPGPFLFALTSSGEVFLRGTQGPGDPISGDNVAILRNGSVGGAPIRPLLAGSSFLYLSHNRREVRELQVAKAQPEGRDLSYLAQHLFLGAGADIVSWAYCHHPNRQVWAARSDGKLLCLTYIPEQDVWGWSLHDVGGVVKDVACIRQPDGDYLGLLVTRWTTATYWEVLDTSRATGAGALDGGFLDCSVRRAPAGITVTGLGHLRGRWVMVIPDGGTPAEGVVSEGGTLTLSAYAYEALVGFPYLSELELLDLAIPEADLKGRTFRVNKAVLELVDTSGVEITEVEEAPATYNGTGSGRTVVDLLFRATWNQGGRLIVRQRLPSPATLLAVTRVFDIDGKA